jgi:hypothetical protein
MVLETALIAESFVANGAEVTSTRTGLLLVILCFTCHIWQGVLIDLVISLDIFLSLFGNQLLPSLYRERET